MGEIDAVKVTKGYLVDLSNSSWDRLEFQFNPGELTDDRQLQSKDVTVVGVSHPKLIPSAGGDRVLSFGLYFHRTSSSQPMSYVKEQCRWLQSLTYPLESDRGVYFPLVQFIFGQLYDLPVRVMRVQVKYPGRFDAATLLPWRAQVSLTLKEQVSESVLLDRARGGDEVYARYDTSADQAFMSGVV